MVDEVPDLALSMIQPMGTAIVRGWKPIENRKWKPWERVIGKRIAIHAGLKFDAGYFDTIGRIFSAWGGTRWRWDDLIDMTSLRCEQGAIIGTARVAGFITEADDVVAGRDRAWFTGPFGWLMEDPIEIETPIGCKGFQSLWRIPDAIRERLAIALARPRRKTP